jgi:drug/metabolite transporter (DMT)-like permease
MKLFVQSNRVTGAQAALISAFFLGLTPVFGKQAIVYGFPPLAVVALRTGLATILLFAVVLLFARRYLYIYPAGFLGCMLAGGINGLGSLFFYAGLGRLDASLGQMIYSVYPLFVVMWLWMDRQTPRLLTLFRLGLASVALILLTRTGSSPDPWGVVFMLLASALYALHLPINQRVLYEMPAPTVTLYTLLAMSLIVLPAYLLTGSPPLEIQPGAARNAWFAIAALTLVTFFSRLTLFLGVKHIGGLQTAILGLGELIITLGAAHLLLAENLTISQWVGVIILVISLAMVIVDKPPRERPDPVQGWLSWLRPRESS